MKRNLTLIAALLVTVSAINIIILTAVAGPQNLVARAIRFGLTCLLGYHLAKGKNWARLTAAIISALGAVTSFLGLLALMQNSGRIPLWFFAWGMIMGMIYAFASLFLFLAKSARRECQNS